MNSSSGCFKSSRLCLWERCPAIKPHLSCDICALGRATSNARVPACTRRGGRINSHAGNGSGTKAFEEYQDQRGLLTQGLHLLVLRGHSQMFKPSSLLIFITHFYKTCGNDRKLTHNVRPLTELSARNPDEAATAKLGRKRGKKEEEEEKKKSDLLVSKLGARFQEKKTHLYHCFHCNRLFVNPVSNTLCTPAHRAALFYTV